MSCLKWLGADWAAVGEAVVPGLCGALRTAFFPPFVPHRWHDVYRLTFHFVVSLLIRCLKRAAGRLASTAAAGDVEDWVEGLLFDQIFLFIGLVMVVVALNGDVEAALNSPVLAAVPLVMLVLLPKRVREAITNVSLGVILLGIVLGCSRALTAAVARETDL